MVHLARPPKPASTAKRNRDIVRLYGSALHDIVHLDHLGPSADRNYLPDDYAPRPAKDAALAAFAQLATIRLKVGHALISLIDDERQYILAEATPNIALHPASPQLTTDGLWLGHASVPRSWGLCERVLTIDPGTIAAYADAAVVCTDLAQTEQYANRIYVKDGPRLRFHAGVALTSPSGAMVGALSVIDDQPRPGGLSVGEIIYLQDLAATVSEFMDTYTLKDQHRRGERMVRGLVSFTEGAPTLQSLEKYQNFRAQPGALDFHPETDAARATRIARNGSSPVQEQEEAKGDDLDRHNSVRALQDSILSMNTKPMFARAANIMRASSGLDGVIILDASVVATVQQKPEAHTNPPVISESTYDSKSSTEEEERPMGATRKLDSPSSSMNSAKRCMILGSSVRDDYARGDGQGYQSLREIDLKRMLRQFPNGKIMNYDAGGEHTVSTDESDALVASDGSGESVPGRKKRRHSVSTAQKTLNVVQAALKGARSVAFVPFWDFERSRWFAGCLCWTSTPDRVLSPLLDVPYFKIFSHSVMNELARLDAMAANQAKTTFMSTISHELRSPLHGILGSVQCMQGSSLDSFQVTMLNTMSACGQTLLDTIDHILDYAKINETSRMMSTKRMKTINSVCLSSKPLRNTKSIGLMTASWSAFDLTLAAEEVIEAVYASQSYQAITRPDNAIQSSAETVLPGNDSLSGDGTGRKNCFIILDLGNQDMSFTLPVGVWRRLIMNIFGNALKFTETGHIIVSLRSNANTNHEVPTHVTLSVTDTGMGMNPDYMANRLFEPFSQENPHITGTGLGLSIVRRIIETIGGKIEVGSDPSEGTSVKVKLALRRPDKHIPPTSETPRFFASLPRLEDKKICILEEKSTSTDTLDNLQTGGSQTRFTDVLVKTLTGWLKMDTIRTHKWEEHEADLVICPKPSFDYLAAIRRRRTETRRAPVTIFVAMDSLEAATLRTDARCESKESVVEIIIQPCGPHKLAQVLNHCLNRFASPDENIMADHTPTPFNAVTTTKDLESERSSVVAEPSVITNIVSSVPPTAPSYVLITDDNAINRKLLAAFLKRCKLPFRVAENGLEAVEAYRKGDVRFNIILMDISMPVLDGCSATRLIREHESKHNMQRTRIIVLSGLTSASAKLEAWTSGIDDYMTKPVNFRKLEASMIGTGSDDTAPKES
ncbi:hypothetical protein BDV95DRAFT_501510 [Massariosphaeria phaeospora]|uniref:Sensor histidine kinase-like protein/response regulator n=1 Tax=Massariosphaeria phaeospora TaxID=100035 RepID=A0A7C8M7C7_9PLEO|nr:hypothetical protein BDV95DRAFT_501510 [Massariosphaeria phaeospora]